MAGFLAYMAAGAGAGAAKGYAEEGKMLREERMREIEQQFRAGEAAKDRTFKGSESEKERTGRLDVVDRQGENSLDVARAQGANRLAVTREQGRNSIAVEGARASHQRHQFTDENGNLWVADPANPTAPAKPVADADGNQLKGTDKEFSDAAAIKAATDPMTGEFDPEKYRSVRKTQDEMRRSKRGESAAESPLSKDRPQPRPDDLWTNDPEAVIHKINGSNLPPAEKQRRIAEVRARAKGGE